LVSAVLGGTATLTKSTDGTVVLSGANDLSGLMEINGGSLVIANAGLLTRGALTVDGTGAALDLGATESDCGGVPIGRGHGAEWKFDGEQLWVGVGVGGVRCWAGQQR
jgi:autotransporter-associated beta strand protein